MISRLKMPLRTPSKTANFDRLHEMTEYHSEMQDVDSFQKHDQTKPCKISFAWEWRSDGEDSIIGKGLSL